MTGAAQVDVVVVGAGFGGLYMLHRLRGLELSARAFEAGDGVGGTWYWNRYPGARCDVESLDYSYSFDPELEQEWSWTERYASQPEILSYLNHVADRYDLRRDITFNTRVTTAHFDDAAGRWTVTTDGGETVSARFVVMATGCLSTPNLPDIPGVENYEGNVYHTGRWPHAGVDFTGQRVAVIGTGSSAIQSIPIIAEQAEQLVVFQRTPNFSVPARNAPLADTEQNEVKARYREFRVAQKESFFGGALMINEKPAAAVPPDEAKAEMEARWAKGGINFLGSFADVIFDQKANDLVAGFVQEKIKATVADPALAELLTPTDYAIGTKRVCVDTGYYDTFNRDNVKLVNLRTTPIKTFTPDGIHTAEDTFTFDSVVFATGFDAMTGTLLRIDIKGRGGVSLGDEWAAGPRSYLGVAVAGFPNLFMITGPGSPSVLSNMVVSIEQHVDWISDCLAWMRSEGCSTIEATPEAQDQWTASVEMIASATLLPKTDSWYTGANIPGKPRSFPVFLGGVGMYRTMCDDIAAKRYEGFALV